MKVLGLLQVFQSAEIYKIKKQWMEIYWNCVLQQVIYPLKDIYPASGISFHFELDLN